MLHDVDSRNVIGMVKKAFTFLVVMSLSNFAHGAQSCGGRVSGVFVDSGSRVYIHTSYRNEWTQICNITESWKGISPELCKQWSSLVTTLRVTQEPVVVYYNESTPCSSIPYYTDSPAPGYVMIAVN